MKPTGIPLFGDKPPTTPEVTSPPEKPPIHPVDHKKSGWQTIAIMIGILLVWGAGLVLLWQTNAIILLVIVVSVGVGVVYQMFFRDAFGKAKLQNFLGKNTGVIVIKSASRQNRIYFVNYSLPYVTIENNTYWLHSGQKSFMRGVPYLEFEEGNSEPLKPLEPTESQSIYIAALLACPKCQEKFEASVPTRVPARQAIPATTMRAYLTELEELMKALGSGQMWLFALITLAVVFMLLGLTLYNVLFIQPSDNAALIEHLEICYNQVQALNNSLLVRGIIQPGGGVIPVA